MACYSRRLVLFLGFEPIPADLAFTVFRIGIGSLACEVEQFVIDIRHG
jgi:hypothetical protein